MIRQYDIWLANLEPAFGTEPGRTRPVLIVQSDLLNEVHFSTLVCPLTTNVNREIELLRVHLKKNQLGKAGDVLVDQIRAIDNRHFLKRIGKLTREQIGIFKSNLQIVLDL